MQVVPEVSGMELTAGARFALSTALYVVAYGAGIAVFASMARRRGLATDGIAFLAGAGLFGGAFGAELTQALFGGVPGKSLLGGVACGYLAVVYVKRQLGIRRPTGDLFAMAIAAGEAIGRIGCFVAQCCYGKATTVAWGVYEHGAMRHPTQLYSAVGAASTLAVLVALERRQALPENGIFYVQGMLMCAVRFVVDFARDVPAPWFGLTTAQMAATCGMLFFAWRLSALVVSTRERGRTPDNGLGITRAALIAPARCLAE